MPREFTPTRQELDRMNRSNGYQQPQPQSRNVSNNSSMAPHDPARPSNTPSMQSSSGNSGMNRAQRFEDEKRRIIESCFSKVDANGQLFESYITHIRINEDASYPSAPPPPDSPPENKKPRIIIIAVKSDGKVRMHKARENNNGSFSVGKTWNLEDLSSIETFANVGPMPNPIKRQYQQWAGSVGFIVTIIKPYYWQALTAKEKDFFIASLVKIYRKYTQGQVPDLQGFEDKERDMILGVAPPQQQPPTRASVEPRGGPMPPQPPFAQQGRPSSSGSQDSRRRQMSSDKFRPSPDPSVPGGRPPSAARSVASQDQPQPPFADPIQQRQASPAPGMRAPRARPSVEQGLRRIPSKERMDRMQRPSQERLRAPSRDRMRPGPAQFGPGRGQSGTPQRLTPQSSHSDLAKVRAESPDVSVASTSSRTTAVTASSRQPPDMIPPQSPRRQRSYQSVQSAASSSIPEDRGAANGAALFNSTVNRWKPNEDRSPVTPTDDSRPPTSQSGAVSVDVRGRPSVEDFGRNQLPEPQTLPERKRPLMQERQGSMDPTMRPPPLTTGRAAAPPPLATAGALPDEARRKDSETPISPLSPEPQGRDRMPGGFLNTPAASTADLAAPQPQPKQEPQQVQPAEKENIPGAFEPSPAATPEVETPEAENEPEEVHRPGLGPMIKKKNRGELANKFAKAATAYNAFKPRAGGAGDRHAKANAAGEPDGINAVVPAPLRKQSMDTDRAATPDSAAKDKETAPQTPAKSAQRPPTVELSTASPTSKDVPDEARPVQLVDGPARAHTPTRDIKDETQPTLAPEPRRQKRRSKQQEKYLRALHIDPGLFDGRGLEFEAVLTDFGWGNNVLQSKKLDDLEADLRRELGRVEAGSWLSHLDQKDERVEMVDQMLDRAIAECDELEGLLTLYGVELSSLNDDIAFIEAQSQGLQVQTANQKTLHTELQRLVDTISITPNQLQALKYGKIGDLSQLEDIESSLVLLYKAMLTIDPTIHSSNMLDAGKRKPSIVAGSSELSNMHALQEKREIYLQESTEFTQRFVQHMEYMFNTTLTNARPALTRSATGNNAFKLNPTAYNAARAGLWPFSPLLLFTKEVNQPAWQTMMRIYHTGARPLYADVFKGTIAAWKSAVRKPTGEESEVLFTSVEKDTSEGLTSTARKLTVKRSQTLAKSLRAASGDKPSPTDNRQPGKQLPCEVFAGVLDEVAPLVSMEQNFVVDLFHATSLENMDFVDAVQTVEPSARTSPDVGTRRLMEPDRAMARRVAEFMDDCFGFLTADLKALLEWAVSGDPLQGVGILTIIAVHSHPLHESSQEYLLRTLTTLSTHLTSLFQKFIDDQIRAIEDTKVKIKKRKGVIAFMKIFPPFSAAVENVFSTAASSAPNLTQTSPAVAEVRAMLDDAYNRINRAMWDSLKVIAKESPSAAHVQAAGGDPEDKEVLNYHILLIENMNHYIEEVDEGEHVLAEWKGRAQMERAEHLEEYVARVVRRPLGKVLDFVESTESLLNQNISGPAIAARPSHSRSAAKKLLATYDAKEIRRGIEALRKRIEKHFGDADEEALSRGLVVLVNKECERRYENVAERLKRVCGEVYREEEKGVEIEWGREDVRAAFRR